MTMLSPEEYVRHIIRQYGGDESWVGQWWSHSKFAHSLFSSEERQFWIDNFSGNKVLDLREFCTQTAVGDHFLEDEWSILENVPIAISPSLSSRSAAVHFVNSGPVILVDYGFTWHIGEIIETLLIGLTAGEKNLAELSRLACYHISISLGRMAYGLDLVPPENKAWETFWHLAIENFGGQSEYEKEVELYLRGATLIQLKFVIFHEASHILLGHENETASLKHIVSSSEMREFGYYNKSQTQELEADAKALDILLRDKDTSAIESVYEVTCLFSILDAISKKSADSTKIESSTHPPCQDRIDNIWRLAPKHGGPSQNANVEMARHFFQRIEPATRQQILSIDEESSMHTKDKGAEALNRLMKNVLGKFPLKEG